MNVGELIYNLIWRMYIERIVRWFVYEGTHEEKKMEKMGKENFRTVNFSMLNNMKVL